MRELIRKHPRWFTLVALAAIGLRLLFIFRFSAITTDSFVYGDIAKNWLQHGVYAISDPQGPIPTYIRLPGYPAFLAASFAIFGIEHYRAVLLLQLVADIATCVLIADMARRTVGERAAKWAFLLSSLCPFLANYVATALTETLEVFFTALALDAAIAGLEDRRSSKPWIISGAAAAAAIVLRPDGGLLLFAIELYLAFRIWNLWREDRRRFAQLMWAPIIVGALALLPLLPWTLRNLHTMHRFQPLAPRYANEENEFVPAGFNRWVKTWIADYTSVEEIYWNVPGSEVDPQKLPSRAFDSPAQRDETIALLQDYNQALHIDPPMDGRFATLAAERVRDAPLHYYLWLPALRIADMWLRPRTEILPADPRWWEFNDDPQWSVVSVAFGLIGLLYVGMALVGLGRWREISCFGLMMTFVVLRSLFLGTLENPEPRYVLECYPVVIVLAAAAVALYSRHSQKA